MASVLGSATAKAAERIAKRSQPHGSIVLILSLIGIVIQVIQFIQSNCREKKRQRLKLFREPTEAHRIMVRRVCRDRCQGEFRVYADSVADAVLAEAAKAKEADCLAVMAESEAS